MATTQILDPPFFRIVWKLLFSTLILCSWCAQSSANDVKPNKNGVHVIEGIVKTEGLHTKAADMKDVKMILNGGEKVTFLRPGGYFAFQNVLPGTHLIEVYAPGYYFSPVRIDVSARLHGQIRASLVDTGRVLSDALVLEPLKQEQYFERREPFSLIGLLKSPMGMMFGFMVVCLFLLPKLMENIDPEEMKKIQDDMRNRPSPSISNLLQGRS